MDDKTHADLETGAEMVTIAAEIVTRVVAVGAARTSGTSSPLNQVLLLPLPLHSSIRVTITLDSSLRLSSRCQSM
eukprot:jgi/Phyca11/509813/fgenesh2_kg.PHYCAscaffold_50_\